jgi:hypothetical protein
MKIKRTDLAQIKAQAKNQSRLNGGDGKGVIFVGERINLNTRETGFNIRAISNQEDWSDTDLEDNAYSIDALKYESVQLHDGRALFDLWINNDDKNGGDLVCHMQTDFDESGLLMIRDRNKIFWGRV